MKIIPDWLKCRLLGHLWQPGLMIIAENVNSALESIDEHEVNYCARCGLADTSLEVEYETKEAHDTE